MTTTTTTTDDIDGSKKFDKNIFYVLFADGRSDVVIAENEDEIGDSSLVISLEEVNMIRERLLLIKHAVENVSHFVRSPSKEAP